MSTAIINIFLTGATGYIGGSVLTALIRDDDERIKNPHLNLLKC